MLRTSIMKELIKSWQSRLAHFDSKKTAHHYIKNLRQINVIPVSKGISINVIKFSPTTTTPNYKFIRPLIPTSTRPVPYPYTSSPTLMSHSVSSSPPHSHSHQNHYLYHHLTYLHIHLRLSLIYIH